MFTWLEVTVCLLFVVAGGLRGQDLWWPCYRHFCLWISLETSQMESEVSSS